MAIEFTQEWIFGYFMPNLMGRSWELITAPRSNPEMLWLVTPLVIVTLIMTLYFGRHRHEELGWNTAFGNSLVLIFVSIDLFRYVFHLTDPGNAYNYLLFPKESIMSGIVFVEGLLLMYANYLHFLPRRVAFFVSSALPVNLTAYTVMCVVYTEVAVDFYTLGAAIFLFILMFSLLRSLQGLQYLMHIRIEQVEQTEKKERILKEVKDEVEEVEQEVEAEEKAKQPTEKETEKKIKEKVIKKLQDLDKPKPKKKSVKK
jgi:hypothetical protein